MGGNLQPRTFDNGKHQTTIIPGPNSDTPEKLRALLEPAMLSYAKAIRKSNPELFKQIVGRYAK